MTFADQERQKLSDLWIEKQSEKVVGAASSSFKVRKIASEQYPGCQTKKVFGI
jgi:hypothetical protein